MKRRKAFDREYRLIQIVNEMWRRSQRGGRDATASEVAGWLDVTSTQARTLLTRLVEQGVLVSTSEPYPGVCGRRNLYWFTPEYLSDAENRKYRATPKPKRTIKINGQQLEIGGLQ